MNAFHERLLHLHHCRGVGWKTIRKILSVDATLEKLYQLSEKELISHYSLQKKYAALLYQDLHFISMPQLLQEYKEKQIIPITIFENEYPPILKQLFDPPWVVYCKGNIALLHYSKALAVVGTREPTKGGRYSLEKIIRPVVEEGWLIVSGLAKGIDTIAHRLTMDNGGKTIAILGSGFDYIYPSSNYHLANEIARDHLLLSEYPAKTKPNKWQFPERNRLISGLSKGTVVVEAKERSGALITADQALEQGKDVFAVPGPIYEQMSLGPNRLIQQGAKLIVEAKDIIEEYENENWEN
ncbi:DNA-processing protein DprA [Alkalihalobacillus sp. LMS39]|uniref:DNA-processing protein DprA n=1 Tax=Alkalihalobacillus sp. LMS39 TaxID=2924032 RepID=UPI001FB4097E|nr:DNA-processing protein DprA [Alkalihalobacillus sp. LMS39]UOE92852.1 DNA-processing protein DprA [Alkalihalobacillus sp. LMS39]